MTEEWDNQPFTECIEPVSADRDKQIKKRQYQLEGKFPIVDQGQGLVGGWTDSEAAVIQDGLPYVVFGDHTRLLKYVDFPFALGADGTKLIKPKDNISPLYFYFHLLVLDIPSRGYSRHYRLLKEKEISLPPLPEQKKIAAVLLKLQRAIETQEKIIQSLGDLKKSTMQHLFTHGLRGEKTKMTEIGEIPESWEVYPLSELREFLQYGTSKRCTLDRKGVAVLRIPNIVGGKIDTQELKYADLPSAERERLILQDGDILFVRTNGQKILVGRTAVYKGNPSPALFASYLIRARLQLNLIRPDFLQYYTETVAGTAYLSGRATPAADGKFNINTKIIDSVLVPVPDSREQDKIVQTIDLIVAKLAVRESKKSAFQDLFKTTLNKLMTGEIRVKDFDIDTSMYIGNEK